MVKYWSDKLCRKFLNKAFPVAALTVFKIDRLGVVVPPGSWEVGWGVSPYPVYRIWGVLKGCHLYLAIN